MNLARGFFSFADMITDGFVHKLHKVCVETSLSGQKEDHKANVLPLPRLWRTH